MQLYPYQQAGVQFLAGRKTALLADDPGLGKTLQAIRACDAARVLKVLVICPAGVCETWKREIAKYREGDWQAFVTSYERATGADYKRLLAQDWDVLVIDECHYLKTPGSKRTTSIYGDFEESDNIMGALALASRAAQVWLLSGTPMPNDPSELFTHLRALYPQAVLSERTGKPWSIHQFVIGYCRTKSTGFGERIVGSKNEAKLNAKLSDFMLRRRKADVLRDLPPMTFGEVWLDANLDGVSTEEAAIVRAALEEHGIDGLRKIAANGSVSALRRLTGLAKAGPAAQWIENWLDSNPKDQKLVVFCHHKEVIEALFDKLHTRAVRVHGSIKQADRQVSIDRMQKDPSIRCFIGQIQAAGTGITLTAASELLFVESSWVPSDVSQAAQRIHRIGQERPCLVRFAMVAGSIDEEIQRALMRKVRSITLVVDGVEHDADRGVFA